MLYPSGKQLLGLSVEQYLTYQDSHFRHLCIMIDYRYIIFVCNYQHSPIYLLYENPLVEPETETTPPPPPPTTTGIRRELSTRANNTSSLSSTSTSSSTTEDSSSTTEDSSALYSDTFAPTIITHPAVIAAQTWSSHVQTLKIYNLETESFVEVVTLHRKNTSSTSSTSNYTNKHSNNTSNSNTQLFEYFSDLISEKLELVESSEDLKTTE